MESDKQFKPSGCSIVIIVFVAFWALCSIFGMLERNKNAGKTAVKIIGEYGNVTKEWMYDSLFTGDNKKFIGEKHVYLNKTGKKLVKYMVKYSTSGSDNSKPIGSIIAPNEFFFWYDDFDDYYMFQTPPSSTTVVTHGHSRKLDFIYLTFLDYLENVGNSVRTSYSK